MTGADFDSQDNLLMGNKTAKRQITHVSDGAIILKDSFNTAEGTIEKQKLVLLYPDQFKWISTHLTGPNKNSQFLYRITLQGKDASFLTFKALLIEYSEKDVSKFFAEILCKEDADTWKLLTKAMEDDLK